MIKLMSIEIMVKIFNFSIFAHVMKVLLLSLTIMNAHEIVLGVAYINERSSAQSLSEMDYLRESSSDVCSLAPFLSMIYSK